VDKRRELNDELTGILAAHDAKVDALLTEWIPSLIRLYEVTDQAERVALQQLKTWFLPELFGTWRTPAIRWRDHDVLGREPGNPHQRKTLDGLVERGMLVRHEWIQPIPKGATTRFKPPGVKLEPVTNYFYTPSETALAAMPALPSMPARVQEIVAEYEAFKKSAADQS